MKHFYFLLSIFILTYTGFAQEDFDEDTLKTYTVPSVTVTSTRAIERISPVPFTEIEQAKIEREHTVQDLPMLLNEYPSIFTYSYSGNGVGYSNMTMRGFDQRRISVLINGIPQNDPEDHNVYWIDVPDIAESLEMIQIQRGAGLINYGAAAIGGSINLTTSNFVNDKGIKLYTGVGYQEFGSDDAFRANTSKFALEASSGLIGEKYAMYGRLSRINSWGYRDHSWAFLNSYFLSAVRYDEKLTTQINVFGGPLTDGLAYIGLPKSYVTDLELRRTNYDYWGYDSTGRGLSYVVPQVAQAEEQFSQPHYEMLNDWEISDNVRLKSSLFYYTGEGHFDFNGAGWTSNETFKLRDREGNRFGDSIPEIQNTIIRAYVGNRHGGWIPRIFWDHEGGQLTAGAEIRLHRSEHWGKIEYAENLPVNYDPNYQFYYNEGERDIYSLFVREQYYLTEKLLVSAEAQGVYHAFRITNESSGGERIAYPSVTGGVAGNGGDLFDVNYFFLNPRLGATYNPTENISAYGSIAFTSREPRMRNLYPADDSYLGGAPLFRYDTVAQAYDFAEPLVKPEKMLDLELGTSYRNSFLNAGVNFYWMEYFDELVKSGQVDIFGSPIDGNAPRTRHAGIELHARADIFDGSYGRLQIYANTTLSMNEIIDFEYITGSGEAISLAGNDIAGFPSAMAAGSVTYSINGLVASIQGKYVGSFYTDNFGEMIDDPRIVEDLGYEYYADNILDEYLIFNANINYNLSDFLGAQNIRFQIQVNNLFNKLYAAGAEGRFFFPGAERHIFLGIGYEL